MTPEAPVAPITPHATIAILHGAVAPDAPPAEQDTLTQVREVAAALAALGHRAVPLPVTLRLDALREALLALRPALVFNLVESIAGQDALLPLAPALVEALGIACTGARAAALAATGDKPFAKRILRRARITAPESWDEPGGGPAPPAVPREARHPGAAASALTAALTDALWIVKSVTQQASFGLDDASVVPTARVAERLAACRARHGGAWFAERFVPGREFNLALLQTAAGVEVLPPAEIQFVDYPPGKPRIVGHAAKWEPSAPEYSHTPRRFDFPPADRPLLARLRRLARRCWDAFALTGYARVDFRVDAQGAAWVLEVNANPCLARDAGFVAAAERSGRSYEALIAGLLQVARGDSAFAAPRETPRDRMPAR